MNPPIDAVDRAILEILREDARTSLAKIALAVNVSESTAHRRLQSLVARGVIKQFTIVEDVQALGQDTEALISIRIKSESRSNLRSFYRFLVDLPQARHTYFIAGSNDFIVHVAVASARELRDFVSDSISSHPDVASTTTALIFEHGV